MSQLGAATGLDHIGVAVADLDAAAAEWAALGFTVQPTAPHLSDGKPTGTGNRNIMLREGYIELLATIDPARPSATIARFLAHHPGIHVLTLAMRSESATINRIVRAGFDAALTVSARPVDPDNPAAPRAEFSRIAFTDADPRLQLLRHITPELVWQEEFLKHPNRALGLRDIIVAADPAFAARLARVAGLPLRPDPAGGLALHLPCTTIRILPPGAIARLLPDTPIPHPPAILAITVQTAPPAPPPGRATGVTVLFTD